MRVSSPRTKCGTFLSIHAPTFSILTYNRPGPATTRSGASPSYFIPWRDKVPLQEKLDQILEWVDIADIDKRPELILSKWFSWRYAVIAHPKLAYEPSLDQAGHATGPMSALVNVSPPIFVHPPYIDIHPCRKH